MMRHIFSKDSSDRILLSFIFSLLLVVTDFSPTSELSTAVDNSSSSTPTPATTTPATTPTTTPTSTPTSTTTPTTTPTTVQPTPPPAVTNVTRVTQNESSITLQWDKVNNISTYRLLYENKGNIKDVIVTVEETSVTHVVSDLSAGTEYSFTLFTVFENISSSGYNFTAVTAPENVESITRVTQNKSSITLQWDKVNNISTYRLLYENKGNIKDIIVTVEETSVTHVVSGLSAGTEYSFILFTVFKNISSSGYNFTAVTTPENVESITRVTQNKSSITLQWDKVNNISTYRLLYENKGNIKDIIVTVEETSVTHVVSGLSAGTEYSFILFTVFKNISSSGYNFTAVTTPENVESITRVTQNKSSITLQWDKVNNISTYRLLYENKAITVDIIVTVEETSVTHVVSDLSAGTEYSFILFTVFKNISSSGYNFTAVTTPDNVKNVISVNQNKSSITLQWDKVNNISTYRLLYESRGNIEDVIVTVEETSVTHVVSDLSAGTEYSFTLFTVFKNISSSGYNFTAVTTPNKVENVTVVTRSESSITLQWNKVGDVLTYKLQYEDNGNIKDVNASSGCSVVKALVSDLTAGREYSFTVFAVFSGVNSTGYDFTAVTVPKKVENVTVIQNESSITLQWKKVEDILTYKLQYENNNINEVKDVNASSGDSTVKDVVSDLMAGTEYKFTVFTVFKNVNSSGHTFTAVTVPPVVSSVRVTERFLNRAIVEWEKPTNDWKYNLTTNGTNVSITPMDSEKSVSYSVSNLQPGTLYSFSVITTFSGFNSAAYEDFILTTIDCESVTWHVTNTSIHGTVEGLFSNACATNGSDNCVRPAGKHVSFTELYPGATYKIKLEYEMNSKSLQQCASNPIVTITPPLLSGHCEHLDSGYSTLIKWNEPDGVWTEVKVNVNNLSKLVNRTQSEVKIEGLQPAKTYKVSLVSLSGYRPSDKFIFNCNTDNKGVIAGSVMGVLIFVVLVCVAVLIFRRRTDIISRKKSFIAGSKKAGTKGKAISVAKFPDHFYQLSLDQNRGFSQEYEDLAPVGTDQTRKVASLQENKAKNRFTNILPYDWCRVKLSTSSPNEILDYINASYMPGYTRIKEYIASQGPLPTTVKDFWRMIWEQNIKRIVMVTNCTEAGRTKCECYWPEDLMRSCLYGELLVTLISEQKDSNWTLREFRVKNRSNSEERTVKHFHFTAWPDHGVPRGTEVLIQFRDLMRRHIESDGTKAPTVVHCSAGVGRTGTIIALDVLLQQLEKEGAVSINNFVRRMRQHRSHMVQTESQYVFLHQCIMDSLKQNEKQEENIYENADMIYANATALREFHNHKSDP